MRFLTSEFPASRAASPASKWSSKPWLGHVRHYPACLRAISLLVGVGVGVSAPTAAAILSFNGSAMATATPFADPSCAPLPFRGIIPPSDGSGTSNVGSFTYSHNVCTQGATGLVTGLFTLDFGASSFSGVLDGTSVARAGTPGVFDQMFTYSIIAGTGRYAGASGNFTNIGFVDGRGGPPSRLTLDFTGTINAPAVPEPVSWAMMASGFGLAGTALRRRRNKAVAV